MKTYTKEEIVKKIEGLWHSEFFYDWDGKKHTVVEPPQIEIEIKNLCVEELLNFYREDTTLEDLMQKYGV